MIARNIEFFQPLFVHVTQFLSICTGTRKPERRTKTRKLLHYTESFNNEVAWMALQMSKLAVSILMGINWRTVGNCIKAAHDRIEPDVGVRLHGLRRICVDETSYRKGHAWHLIHHTIFSSYQMLSVHLNESHLYKRTLQSFRQ